MVEWRKNGELLSPKDRGRRKSFQDSYKSKKKDVDGNNAAGNADSMESTNWTPLLSFNISSSHVLNSKNR